MAHRGGLTHFLLGLCGCTAQTSAPGVPSGAPTVVFTDCRREQDSEFSLHEQSTIAAARRHLEQIDKRPIDAYYRVTRTADGFEVFVICVTGYTDSQPSFIPGGHCTVLLREDGSVIRVLGGA
jgi:hypothetical protein